MVRNVENLTIDLTGNWHLYIEPMPRGQGRWTDVMDNSSTTEDPNSSAEEYEVSDHSSEEGEEEEEEGEEEIETHLGGGSSPNPQAQQQPSDSSSDNFGFTRPPLTISLSLPQSPLSSQIGAAQARGRSLRNIRRLRGQNYYRSTPTGDRIREIVRRPRCGLHLLRSLRNDKNICVPEARSNPEKPPRQPGRADKLFTPKDGDLLLHHVKKLGKRVVEFFDAEQPPNLEEGDYLLRFKVDNYSFTRQSFVTARAYLYHHEQWVYLGKDADQMDLA